VPLPDLVLRAFVPADTPAICQLYAATTRAINGQHYTSAQVERWAGFAADQEGWCTRLGRNRTIVADLNGLIVGFAELEPADEVGYVYVDAQRQGQGIGTRLMRRLLLIAAEGTATQLHADVSISAMPFFAAQGFTVVARTEPIVCGAAAPRYRMTCAVPSPPA